MHLFLCFIPLLFVFATESRKTNEAVSVGQAVHCGQRSKQKQPENMNVDTIIFTQQHF